MKFRNDISRRKFFSASLIATGAVVTLGNSSGAHAQVTHTRSSSWHDDLKKAAQHTYMELKNCFQKSDNYWRLGHTFDTIIDYLIIVNTNNNEAKLIGKLALEKYATTAGAWYDDYAWWAIANLRASQHKDLFGDAVGKFHDNCIQGWHKMAPCSRVWDQAKKNPKFQAIKPLIAGGVWNHDYESGANSPFNPISPAYDALGGYQNTVTNGLYLVLAARLTRQSALVPNPYREAMDREYKFLQRWFTISRPGITPLLNVYSEDRNKAIVRERVSCYDSGIQLHDFRRNLAWAGDQGLIIGGLAERMEIVTKQDPSYPAMLLVVRQVLAGVRQYLAVDGQLLPWWPDPAPGYDWGDYRTGLAVFMRYLLHVYISKNEDLKDSLSPYKDFVSSNARHVLRNPNLTDGGVDSMMVALTNNLSILCAAIAIAGE